MRVTLRTPLPSDFRPRNCESRRSPRRDPARRTGESARCAGRAASRSWRRAAPASGRSTAASSRATARATKPGIGPKGARRPLPDVAEAEAPGRALVRRRLPLDLARQPAAGPAAPGLGLEGADMDRRLGAGDAAELAEAAPQHAVAHLVDVARRAPRLALDPGPAGLAPVGALVVAAVLDELAVLRPGHRLGVDLELGNGDRMRCALVVEARSPAHRRPAASASPERRAAAARANVATRGTRPSCTGTPRVCASTAKSSRRISSWNRARRWK